jgi:hypothetical protein
MIFSLVLGGGIICEGEGGTKVRKVGRCFFVEAFDV